MKINTRKNCIDHKVLGIAKDKTQFFFPVKLQDTEMFDQKKKKKKKWTKVELKTQNSNIVLSTIHGGCHMF